MSTTTPDTKDKTPTWRNWSGSQRYRTRSVVTPTSLPELTTLVGRAAQRGQHLRCVGSAHSFVPFWTDDVILSLDGFKGLIAVDADKRRATIAAGTKLHELGPLLWEQGLSLPQQGDIDRQSLAGALCTGTHGTGIGLKNLPNALRAVTLMTPAGNLLQLTPEQHPEEFSAAQVSQGLLGIMVDATLQLDAAYCLHERTWNSSVADCRAQLDDLIDGNRHFEFFWAANTDSCQMKTLNKTDEQPARISDTEYIAPAYVTFPSDREVKFNEMEYSVPFASGWECFSELRHMLLDRYPKLPWPLEYRTLAADEVMLSTAYQRNSVTISVHQGAERDYAPLFAAAEAIFRNHAGRPHWGKLHSLTAAELAALYPRYADFCELRRRRDPDGMFLNDYLTGLFN